MLNVRDANALDKRRIPAWQHAKLSYKVGSCFKGCAHCGDWEMVTLSNGRDAKRYSSGHNVYRAYYPVRAGYTYLCWDCMAKDGQCWAGDNVVYGADAIQPTAVKQAKERAKAKRPRKPDVAAPWVPLPKAGALSAKQRALVQLGCLRMYL